MSFDFKDATLPCGARVEKFVLFQSDSGVNRMAVKFNRYPYDQQGHRVSFLSNWNYNLDGTHYGHFLPDLTEAKLLINMTDKYVLRESGYSVRILAIDAPGHSPVVGALDCGTLIQRFADGRNYKNVDSDYDIIPKPKADVVEYVVLRPHHGYSTLEAAKQASNPSAARHYLKTTYSPDRQTVKSMEIVQ